MVISRDMVSDSINISKLIVKENLAQRTMPTEADTAKYNSLIKPEIETYTTKHGNNPRMILQQLLKKYVTSHNLAEDFEAKGIHYWGRRISPYVWAAITKKDKEGKYNQNKISNYPQLYVSINSKCIHFGLSYGEYVPDNSQMVKIVKDNKTLQQDIKEVLNQEPGLKVYDGSIGTGIPSPENVVSATAPSKIADKWSRNAHLVMYYEQNNIPTDIESEITTTFDKLLKIFLEISEAEIQSAGEEKISPSKTYWFVGAHWGANGDQTRRFLDDGIWENGYIDRYADQVKSIRPGDRIAIKAAYTRKKKLPFDNKGHVVAAMKIKAVGTVINNTGDGRRLEVEWTEYTPPREWYFFTDLHTVWKVERDNWYKEALIDFTFDNKPQDYPRFQNDPFWEGRFGTGGSPIPPEDTGKPSISWVDIEDSLNADFSKTDFDITSLYFDPETKIRLTQQIISNLKIGKHIILIGPPGTGKSKLAKEICDHFRGANNYTMATATSDWSTFDTIGGYRPKPGSELAFFPGYFLKCFQDLEGNPDNNWLIIDELNRADIDKAFGALFSALTGDNVTLHFELGDNKRIEIIGKPWPDMDIQSHRFVIHPDWRLIATMNTLDKSSLYDMSYAFMRRFAFIPVEVPKESEINTGLIKSYVRKWGLDIDERLCEHLAELWKLTNRYRKIGPAIVEDIYKYAKETTDYCSAVIMYILPQFEGILEDQAKEFIKKTVELDFITGADSLLRFAADYLNIDEKKFRQ